MCIHASQADSEGTRLLSQRLKNINLQDLRYQLIIAESYDPARQHVYAELWEEQLRSVRQRDAHRGPKLNRLRSGLGADLLSGPCPDGGIVSFGQEWETGRKAVCWSTWPCSAGIRSSGRSESLLTTVARLSDRDVLLEQRLRSALVKINLGPARRAVA